jgi:hypothetical protein
LGFGLGDGLRSEQRANTELAQKGKRQEIGGGRALQREPVLRQEAGSSEDEATC